MTGTIVNVAGIVAGGLAGLIYKKPLAAAHQAFFKTALGAFTVFFGLRLTWLSINGTFLQSLKQFGIVLLALVLGRLAGRLLGIQNFSNRLGRSAREKIAATRPDHPRRFSNGFEVCAILFCAAPLGILGAVCDGLTVGSAAGEYFYPLLVKAVMDGLAAMSFVGMFGAGVLLSAVPVLVFQGSIALLCARVLGPFLETHALVNPINATAGLLILFVALIIFEVKKVAVADYLPSLVFAPLLAYWFR